MNVSGSDGGTEVGGHDVLVVGCGLMGAALARAFAVAGFSVAAWNRTFERAQALSGDSVTPVRSLTEGVASAPLVVACLTSFDATLAAFDGVDSWRGVTLVNLGSTTPEGADGMTRWAAERGAELLDGAICCYPREIGSPHALIVCSGSRAAWSKHGQTLASLGGILHVSDEPRIASVLSVAIGTFLIPLVGSYAEAAVFLQSQGLSAAELRGVSATFVRILRTATGEAVAAIDRGELESDQATLSVWAEAGRADLAAIRGVGQRGRILGAAVANLEAAETGGLGQLGIWAQTRFFGTRDATSVAPDGHS